MAGHMEIILLVVLIVLVVALFVISYMKKKKFNTELGQMREDLKVGDKVMTDAGVVGEVVDSYVEEEYKYFVLKTGKDKNIGYCNQGYKIYREGERDDIKCKIHRVGNGKPLDLYRNDKEK